MYSTNGVPSCQCARFSTRVPVVHGQRRCSSEESTTLAFFPVRSALPQLSAYLKGKISSLISGGELIIQLNSTYHIESTLYLLARAWSH